MKTEQISKLIEKIDNNFFSQKMLANKIEDLRDDIKNKNAITRFFYSESDLKTELKNKVKLLYRLKKMNAANIAKLAELNKAR